MKSTSIIIALALAATISVAQDATPSKIRVGLYANAGTSSLVQGMGMNMNMNMYGSGYSGMNSNTTMYSYAGSWGGGMSLTVPLHQRWSFVGNVGYMNRGANYGEMYSSYNSRYQFSYLDVWAMGQYNSLPSGSVKFTAVLGVTESTLLSAIDHTSGANQGMMDNVNRVDIGMVVGPGLEFGLKKGAIQTRLLYTYGFMNVFSGMYYDSGMYSNNAAFLLQVGYLFN
jgi:hypothetical protein